MSRFMCQRCGRNTHFTIDCYARTCVHGSILDSDSERKSTKTTKTTTTTTTTTTDTTTTTTTTTVQVKKRKIYNIVSDPVGSVECIYVLELEGGRYYVGRTSNKVARMNDHSRGNGASWTRRYGVVREIKPVTPKNDDIESWERAETLELAHRFGIDFVRGSVWTTIYMSFIQRSDFILHICERKNLCRKCGEGGHMISDCRNRKMRI